RMQVTLAFEPDEALFARFNADGFELEPGEEATFVREMTAAGKSSVRVNGRAATAGYLRDVGTFVAQIVGQHEAQRLLMPAYHLDAVDRFAGDAARTAKERVARAYEDARSCEQALRALQGDDRNARELYEDARFALDEIDGIAPVVGEDARLEERRHYLDHAERIAAALRGAYEALAGDDASAGGSLGDARVLLGSLGDISTELHEMASQAGALQSEAAELATRIARELDATEYDPAELESINARLDALDRLKRRFGRTLGDVQAHATAAREIVATFEGRDRDIERAQERLVEAQRALTQAATSLSTLRSAAASKLQASIQTELADLALANAVVEAQLVTREAIGPDGAESIELLFTANPAEPLRPLSKVVSGGELSRLLLALVVVLAELREPSALVFDEIDAGIGGTTATAVGARIGRLARSAQVLCVTHLAQLAAWADRHYVLDKRVEPDLATIALREIDGDAARSTELARMLSGESHAIALEHALALLHGIRVKESGAL
ncbi:MAG: DNA repair protein RecN, partial [Vulcanimicrobiaceae bacterium]